MKPWKNFFFGIQVWSPAGKWSPPSVDILHTKRKRKLDMVLSRSKLISSKISMLCPDRTDFFHCDTCRRPDRSSDCKRCHCPVYEQQRRSHKCAVNLEENFYPGWVSSTRMWTDTGHSSIQRQHASFLWAWLSHSIQTKACFSHGQKNTTAAATVASPGLNRASPPALLARRHVVTSPMRRQWRPDLLDRLDIEHALCGNAATTPDCNTVGLNESHGMYGRAFGESRRSWRIEIACPNRR